MTYDAFECEAGSPLVNKIHKYTMPKTLTLRVAGATCGNLEKKKNKELLDQRCDDANAKINAISLSEKKKRIPQLR